MLTLKNQELRKINNIKVIQRKITLARYLFILGMFFLLVAVLTKAISPSIYVGVLIGLITSLIMFEVTMLRYNHSDYLLGIIQKRLLPPYS
jgi:hypothetical protein